MKFSKKVLIGLLTATCAVAGTVGLAACQGNGNKPEQPTVTIGDNGNVFVNGVDTGIAAKTDVSLLFGRYLSGSAFLKYKLISRRKQN